MTMWNNFLWKNVSLCSLKVIGWNLASFNLYTSAFGTAHYYEKEIWPNSLVFFPLLLCFLSYISNYLWHMYNTLLSTDTDEEIVYQQPLP